MSSYGPTFNVTPVDLCIIVECNLYISCKTIATGNVYCLVEKKLFQDKRKKRLGKGFTSRAHLLKHDMIIIFNEIIEYDITNEEPARLKKN